MLFNLKTNEQMKETDCMQCEYYDKKEQTCKGREINCIEKDDIETLISVNVNGKVTFVPMSEIKLQDGQTLADLTKCLKTQITAYNDINQRLEKVEAEVKNIYSNTLEA